MTDMEDSTSGVPFQVYVDSKLDEVRRAADLALSSAGGAVPLQDHFDAILDEQRRGMLVAEQEREKSAQALASTLAEQIRAGDQSLRDHVDQQVIQINAALDAAERLEVERITKIADRLEGYNEAGHIQIESRIAAVEAAAEQHVEQLRRERELVTGAQMEAIAKAESASDKRFEDLKREMTTGFAQANEWRGQSSDRERTQKEQIASLTNTLMPREVADAKFKEQGDKIDSLTRRLDRGEGTDLGREKAKAGFSSAANLVIGILVLAVAVLSIMVTVILANGAGPG